MKKNVYGIFITEWNLLKFILLVFIGRKYCVIGVYSYLQNHEGYLLKIIDFLHKKKLIEKKSDRDDQFPYKNSGDLRRLTDVFSECEEWMEEQFQMSKYVGEYSQVCKHIICSRTYACLLYTSDAADE